MILYGIPKVIIGENVNYVGEEEWLKSRGVDVTVLNDPECIKMMGDFIKNNPKLWNEDIGL
jgi:cytosine deaminase